MDKHGRNAFLWILAPKSTKYFHPATLQVLEPPPLAVENGEQKSFSKKPAELRQQELLNALLEPLIPICLTNISMLIRSQFGNDVLFEVIRNAPENEQSSLIEGICNLFQEEEDPILDNYFSSRFLIRLIKESPGNEIELFPSILCSSFFLCEAK